MGGSLTGGYLADGYCCYTRRQPHGPYTIALKKTTLEISLPRLGEVFYKQLLWLAEWRRWL